MDMMYLMILWVVIYCKITQGVLEWIVIGKVTDYGQNVTLFCNVSHCCPDDAGWDRWTPVQQTLFIDVKAGGGEKKYDGKVMRDGYTLIIQNLTKDDLNVSYSCLYGVTLGERKFLMEEDVFSYTSNKQYNVPIGSSSQSAGNITGITIGVIFVLGTVVGFLIYYKTRTKAPKDKKTYSKLLMTVLDNEKRGVTNSYMSNDEQDVKDDDPASLNKTLIKGDTDSPSLQSSGLESSESTDDRPEVISNNPGLLKSQLFPGKTDSATLQSSYLESSVSNDDRPEVICNSPGILKSQLFPEWPTDETNSLVKFEKNTRTQLMKIVQTDRIYDTDPKKQCRVLCILNEKSKDKIIYNSKPYIDTEITSLQIIGKKLRWDIETYLNKSSSEIIKILENETKREFKSVRALFVIVVSSGDQSGIYGTTGRKIKNNEITTKFEQVADLKDKPKIFILDCCDKKSNIRHHKKFPEDQLDHSKVQKPDRDTNICNESSENGINIQDEGVMLNAQNLNKTRDGKNVLVTYTRFEHVPDSKLDIYTCIANTLGRCDEIVKGSWVIGALLSVICEAGHAMTFQEMMKEVQIMVTEAIVPGGKPEPEIKIKDCLSKDFYLLPPSP